MKKVISLLFCLLCLPVFANAQTGSVTVTGSNIVDSTGTALANGTIYFAPVNNTGVPISYQFSGKGQTITATASANVIDGAFSLTLADTSMTRPVNVCFSVTVINNVSGAEVLGPGYGCVQPAYNTTGLNDWCAFGVCNFDNYVPELPANLVTTIPNIVIGTVSTLAPGSAATASVRGTTPDFIFNFGIPAGPAATVTIGSYTTGTPGTSATVTNSGTTQNAILNFQLPAGTPGTTSSTGASGNWSVTNTSWAGRISDELPRVDITYPAFGTGCSSVPADPSGTNDSTCAINAAIAYAVSLPVNGSQPPCVYVPAGLYKVSSAIRITREVCIEGDGKAASVIQNTATTSNLFTVYSANPSGSQSSSGLQISNLTLEGNGHLSNGTLLEIFNTTNATLTNVALYNNGGRGLALYGSSERFKSWGLEIQNVRWPIVEFGDTNENHFFGSLILSPGQTADGYVYNINAVSGVFPSANQGTPVSATWSASAFVPGGYIISDGTTNCSGHACNQQAQNTGTTGTSTPSWASSDGGTVVDGGVTWKDISIRTLIAPDNHVAVKLEGVDNTWSSSSIKALQFLSGMQLCGEDCEASHSYFEGFTASNNHSVVTTSWPEEFPLTAAMTGTGLTATVSNYQWSADYLNDPADAGTSSTHEGQYTIFPQDYSPNVTSASAYVTGVNRNQYELVTIEAVDSAGTVHVVSRNNSSSTAPASTAWPVGSFMVDTSSWAYTGYNGGKLTQDHIEAVQTPPSGYAWNCNENKNPCAEVIAGVDVDGVLFNGPNSTSYSKFQGGAPPSRAIAFDNTSMYDTVASVFQGLGEVKAPSYGNFSFAGNAYLAPNEATLNTSSPYTTGLNIGNIYVVGTQWPSGYDSGLTITAPLGFYYNAGAGTNTLGMYQTIPFTDSQAGHPYQGLQYQNGYCITDIPSSGTQAQGRFCVGGGPTSYPWGNGFDYQQFSGGAWTDIFHVNGTSLTGTLGSNIPLLNSFNQFAAHVAAPGGITAGSVSLGSMTNLVLTSAGFTTNWGIWYGTGPTLTTGQVDPWGGTTADQVVVASGNNGWGAYTSLTANTPYTECAWLKGATGTEAIGLYISGVFARNLTLSTSWQYLCGTTTVSTGSLTHGFEIETTGSLTYYIAGASISLGTSGSPYLATNGTPVSTPVNGVAVAGVPLPTAVYEGRVTLSSGTATVSTSAASATANYTLTDCGPNSSTAIGVHTVGTITAGTSFVINALSATNSVVTGDASTVCWWIH